MKQDGKSFYISKRAIYSAYLKVKANKGGAGVDGKSINQYGKNLKGNLYKLWNRMSSGSYFPPAVKRVQIPKKDGKRRPLGIPTVEDRIAQTVVRDFLEPSLEKEFHPNSYGYRPNKSAHQAVLKARERCWQKDWVIDLDIKGFFDNIDHKLMMKAVKHCTKCKWIILYINRWLKAPVEENGDVKERTKGTPQGGVISPLLANLFLHFAFDKWMERSFSHIKFERYADDIIIHCNSEKQAKMLLKAIDKRMKRCGLELHPDKTKIIYCKDANRKQKYSNTQFDFLGFNFRVRTCRNKKGKLFEGFCPSISKQARQSIYKKIREWNLNGYLSLEIKEIGKTINPQILGWKNYYEVVRPWELMGIWLHIESKLIKWVRRKYRRFVNSAKRAWKWLREIAKKEKELFAHWTWLYKT